MQRALGFVAIAAVACATAEIEQVAADASDEEGDAAATPDAAGAPDAAPGDDAIGLGCTLSPQGGCPADTPACDLDLEHLSTGGTECRDVDAPGRETDLCTYLEDCDSGYACIGDATTASCLQYCRTNADCAAPGGACLVTLVDASDNDVPGVLLCTQSCDYMVHGGCPAGWGCHLYRSAAGLQYTACATPGAGAQGATCVTDRDCQQSFSCYQVTEGTMMTRKCLQHCRVTTPASTCTTGTCTRGTTPIMMGGVEYGACLD